MTQPFSTGKDRAFTPTGPAGSVLTSNGPNVNPSYQNTQLGSTNLTLTAAQLKNLVLNPAVLVPAPGVGKRIIPISLGFVYHPGTTPYTDPKTVTYATYLSNPANSAAPISATVNPGATKIGANISAVNLGLTNMAKILSAPAITNPSAIVADIVDNAAAIFLPEPSGTAPILPTKTTLTGQIQTIGIAYPGKGYSVNDVLSLTAYIQSSPGQVAQFTVSSVDANGGVTGITATLASNHSAIASFPAKFLPTTGGGGSGCYLNVVASVGGQHGIVGSNITAANAGTGYAIGDAGTVTFANATSATYVVDTVDGGGAVLTYHLTSVGAGYIVQGALATSATSGSGTGLKLDVTATGGGYAVGDTGTIAGGSADATYIVNSVDANGNVLTYTITGAGTAYSLGNYYAAAKGGGQPGIGLGLGIVVQGLANDVTLGDGTLEVNFVYAIVNT